jgi:8-oxo-dGTP pyrophosphatase MutT (NUDIX family)
MIIQDNGTAMHREKLMFLLNNYFPIYSEEQVYQNDMLQFISLHKNCFDRSLESGHITASSWLLNKDHTQALLMHHAKLDRWVQLGGHCDGNSDCLEVAIKEACEESGLTQVRPVLNEIFDIDIHLIPPKGQIREHLHYDVRFLLESAGDEPIVCNRESKELRWVGKNQTEFPTDSRSVVRLFIKWKNLAK